MGSTGANCNGMKAHCSHIHVRNLDCKQREDLKLVGQKKRCHFPLGKWRRSITSLQLRQTMPCVSSPKAYGGSANHIGRFFFFLFFFFLQLQRHIKKKVITEEKWDLAQ